MPDQLITILGTLGGAIIGFVGTIIVNARSSSHQLKLEKLRMDDAERKEKTQQKVEVIREAYQTLINVDDLCTQLAFDVKNPNNHNRDTVERIKNIRSTSQRISVLIRLHLPDLGKDLEEYTVNLSSYWNTIAALDAAAEMPRLEILYEKLAQTEFAYSKTLEKIFIKLEELVK